MDFKLSAEQIDIKNAAKEFALGEFPDRAQEFDRNETFDLEIWKKAAKLGFVAVTVSENYGGPEFGKTGNLFDHRGVLGGGSRHWIVDYLHSLWF